MTTLRDVPPHDDERAVIPRWIWAAGGGFFAVVILGAIALPSFFGMNQRAMSTEITGNVQGIHTAELSYDAAFDGYVPVPEPVPRPVAALDRKLLKFPEGTAFETLGWRPDGEVRGTYWVEVTGDDFVVHGAIDIDQDGEPRHVVMGPGDREPRDVGTDDR